jgi:hypothetical protein
MDQKYTPQHGQLDSAPLEEQRLAHSDETTPAQSTQREPASRQVHRCANCDIEFFWPPTAVQGKIYCCTGCAAGGPCNCDYSLYRPVIIMGVVHYEQ